jgi:hypothetical protein
MSDSPQAKRRFRIALSFPGEHRSRVESIANMLAASLGREKILYDKWHAAESARPNLDTYLSKLYHDESDLITIFLCKEYDQKEWCGLEWRACRDLLKRKQDARLMFLRLDDADMPGLYSIDGYLDIRTMSDAEVADAILQRLGEPGEPPSLRDGNTARSLRIFLCHSSGDKPAVRALYRRLINDGFRPWLDEEDLLPGQDWQRELPIAVKNSDVVIVCLSRASITKTGYVQKEIKFALDVADEQPEGTIFLIPLRLEECEVPGRLSRWQWVNLFEPTGYERLIRALAVRKKSVLS